MMSCKTNQLYLNVLQPAPVTLPQEVRKVGVINRSIPTDETKAIDALDRILSLEGADLDRVGAWESISGLPAELRNNDRFNEVRELDEIDFRASRIEFCQFREWQDCRQSLPSDRDGCTVCP